MDWKSTRAYAYWRKSTVETISRYRESPPPLSQLEPQLESQLEQPAQLSLQLPQLPQLLQSVQPPQLLSQLPLTIRPREARANGVTATVMVESS